MRLLAYGLFVAHVCQLFEYIMDIFARGHRKGSMKRFVEICGGKRWSKSCFGVKPRSVFPLSLSYLIAFDEWYLKP